ncbi:MAG: Flp family type IVb pilin [Hyphomonadaceae bacterium]|nr:Flp family type IVb pilin [Hyphomonadaceae bacterium]
MKNRFATDRSGTTAIEYAVIASLIALAIFAAIAPIGPTLSNIFGGASAGLEGN